MIGFVTVGILLVVQSIWDIWKRELPLSFSLAGAGIGLIDLWLTKTDPVSVLLGILPGIGCLLVSKLTREAIGYGDSILICVLGLFYDGNHLLKIGMIAVCFASLLGMGLLLAGKKRQYEIPFVPFLFLGWAIVVS